MFVTDGVSITWRGSGETLRVEGWGLNSLRVRARMMGEILDTEYALLHPAAAHCEIEVDGDAATIRNGKIDAVLRAVSVHNPAAVNRDQSQCEVEFRRSDGRTLLKELPTGGSLRLKARHWEPITGGDHQLTASFESDPAEKL